MPDTTLSLVPFFVEKTKDKHHSLVNTTDEDNNDKGKYMVTTRYTETKKDLIDCSPVLKGLKDNPNQVFRYFCKEESFTKFQKIVAQGA